MKQFCTIKNFYTSTHIYLKHALQTNLENLPCIHKIIELGLLIYSCVISRIASLVPSTMSAVTVYEKTLKTNPLIYKSKFKHIPTTIVYNKKGNKYI